MEKQTRFKEEEDEYFDARSDVGSAGDGHITGLPRGREDDDDDRVSFMTGSTGKSSFNINKFFITPIEQRELSMARSKLQRYDERINHEKEKIEAIKHDIQAVSKEIAEKQSQVAFLQMEDEALVLEFIQTKLIYELECRKKQMHEKEVKRLKKIRETKETECLRKGWTLQREQANRRKHEHQTEHIVDQVNRIQSMVEDLSEDVQHYRALDKRLKSTIHQSNF